MLKAVCFDLDGTLLPLDIDKFCDLYFGMLAKKLEPYGYDPEKIIAEIIRGTKLMYRNDGSRTNEEVFWDNFVAVFGERARADIPVFEEFYQNEFDAVQKSCGFEPRAAEMVRACKALGLRVAVATNPFFPAVATRKRLSWSGVSPDEVEFFTTYENCRFSKPNPEYFRREVAERLGLSPDECLMVGNDVDEDMAAAKAGMHVFLLVNEFLLNRKGADMTPYPQGDIDAFLSHVKSMVEKA